MFISPTPRGRLRDAIARRGECDARRTHLFALTPAASAPLFARWSHRPSWRSVLCGLSLQRVFVPILSSLSVTFALTFLVFSTLLMLLSLIICLFEAA